MQVMWCPARSAATHLAKAGHKVFLYDFVHEPAMSLNWPTGTSGLGAFHGAEVPFVFGDTFELVGGEVSLSQTMSQFWTNMASSGDPNKWVGPTAPQWTPPTATADSLRRSLQPAPGTRPASWVYWWHISGATCEAGSQTGKACGASATEREEQILACKKVCMADPSCGGFEQAYVSKGTHSQWESTLKDAGCIKEFKETGVPTNALFVLRGQKQPPAVPQAPRVQLPWNCSTFSQGQSCYNSSDTYRSITINITFAIEHGSGRHGAPLAQDLGKCCDACSKDKQCKLWFVPRESNGTECRLVYKDSVEGFKRPRQVTPVHHACVSGERVHDYIPVFEHMVHARP